MPQIKDKKKDNFSLPRQLCIFHFAVTNPGGHSEKWLRYGNYSNASHLCAVGSSHRWLLPPTDAQYPGRI